MVKLFPAWACMALAAMICVSVPAEARSSQPIADWSKVEQDDGDFVTCPAAIRSADRTFSRACLVGVRTTADASRMVNVLGFYDRNGIPRANPDPRVEPLPRLYNLTPAPAPSNAVAASRLKAGDTFAISCAGNPETATFSRIETSTNRITAYVPSLGGRALVRWELDGTPVGRNTCRIVDGATDRSSAP